MVDTLRDVLAQHPWEAYCQAARKPVLSTQVPGMLTERGPALAWKILSSE
jgi:hypothetical protein